MKILLLASMLTFGTFISDASATTFFASGQLLVENSPGTHDDVRENYIFSVDTLTGVATPVSPVLAGTPAGLAGTSDNRLLGYNAGQLVAVTPNTGAFTPIGGASGLSSTGFEIVQGLGYLLTFTDDRLYSVRLDSGQVQAIGSPITLPGLAADPFVISLGAVHGTLYGINLGTGANNLISIDPLTAQATVIGTPNAVEIAGYSGFSALTGVDEDGDGAADSLFGNVNFLNAARIGGIVRYDLVTGTWSLIGTNPGVIFFGFGQAVPEPASVALLAIGLAAGMRKRRKQRASQI